MVIFHSCVSLPEGTINMGISTKPSRFMGSFTHRDLPQLLPPSCGAPVAMPEPGSEGWPAGKVFEAGIQGFTYDDLVFMPGSPKCEASEARVGLEKVEISDAYRPTGLLFLFESVPSG